MSDMERDIEASRARLDRTIDQIQDRLAPGNLVEEMLGTARRAPGMNGFYDAALDTVRRNPLPVLLIAAGVSMLFGKLSRAESARTVSADPVAPRPPAGDAPGI